MARTFAGGTDRIIFGAYNGATVGCISFWIKTTQTTSIALPFSIWNGSSRTGLGFILNDTASKITVQCYNSTGTPAWNHASTVTINDGNWHHVAFNFNTANGAAQTLYIDGVADASFANGAAWSFASTSMTFGGAPSFWAAFVGTLAEVAIFTGRILVADEIIAMSKGFAPTHVAQPVDGYWPFVNDQHNKRDGFISSTTGTTVSDHPRIMAGLT